MSIHEKINIRSYFNSSVQRAIEPYLSTLEELKIWKRNEKPYTNPQGKY